MTQENHAYRPVPVSEVPEGIIWYVPAQYRGKTVEVAWSTGLTAGKLAETEARDGAPWKRVTDRKAPAGERRTYYKRR